VITTSDTQSGTVFCEIMRFSTTSLLLGPLRGSDIGARLALPGALNVEVHVYDAQTVVLAAAHPESLTIIRVRLADLPLLR
jgi:hypothetical protein